MKEENAHNTSEDTKKGGANARAENAKHICFIIMPFGGLFDRYYKEIYEPAIKEAGYEPKRADDIYIPGNIVEQIWNYTKKANIILADLTEKNPNVLYELGLAHAISKPAILVTESLDDIPFDLRPLRHIQYDKNFPAWGDCLKKDIITAIRETESDPKMAIPSAFMNVTDRSGGVTITNYDKEFLEIKRQIAGMQINIRDFIQDLRCVVDRLVTPPSTSQRTPVRLSDMLGDSEKSLLNQFVEEAFRAKAVRDKFEGKK